MKNGNFEMDDEEYMEALDLRDEYRYAQKLNHNNPWWNELEELAKKGNIEEYTNFWTSNGVDDSDAYFVWMYNRGPLREEKNNNYPIEPLEDVKNFSPIKFMSYVK